MNRIVFVVLASISVVFGAEDTWDKVRELKRGTELRIQKKGVAQPVLAVMDEANEERILVVLKNEQVSIHKDQVDRLESRPKSGNRVTPETKVSSKAPGDPELGDYRPGGPTAGGSSSYSSGVTIGGKPKYELVYRRQMGAAAAKPAP